MKNHVTLLLVEIVGTELFSQYRSELFPFLQGFIKKLGIDTLWISFGLPHKPDISERYFIDLPKKERGFLVKTINEQNTTHLLFNESLKPEFSSFLSNVFPSLNILCIGDIPDSQKTINQFSDPSFLIKYLKVNDEADEIVQRGLPLICQVTPDYGRIYGNKSAADCESFIKLLCGPECLYKNHLSRNPYFQNIDLTNATRDYGCSFCDGPPEFSVWPFNIPPLELAFLQLRAVLKTYKKPKQNKPYRFLVYGKVLFDLLDKFIKRLVKENFPRSEFLFSCRADELCKKENVIEKWLPELNKRDFKLHVWVIGIENFSKTENDRFNKGITNKQILKCQSLINKWEELFPETFCFNKYGGYSYILFTPWTTISDLQINLTWAKRLGFHPQSYFLESRLQLLPNLPITLLAQHHHLTADSFNGPFFDSGCINSWQKSEIPWRFKHKEVGIIYTITSRLTQNSDYMSDDQTYIIIQNWIMTLPLVWMDPFLIFEGLLKVMKRNPYEESIPKILQNVHKYLINKRRIDCHTDYLKQLKRIIVRVTDRFGGEIKGFKLKQIIERKYDRVNDIIGFVFKRSKDFFVVNVEINENETKVIHDSNTPPDSPEKVFFKNLIKKCVEKIEGNKRKTFRQDLQD